MVEINAKVKKIEWIKEKVHILCGNIHGEQEN